VSYNTGWLHTNSINFSSNDIITLKQEFKTKRTLNELQKLQIAEQERAPLSHVFCVRPTSVGQTTSAQFCPAVPCSAIQFEGSPSKDSHRNGAALHASPAHQCAPGLKSSIVLRSNVGLENLDTEVDINRANRLLERI
jgi:hypothetical protein